MTPLGHYRRVWAVDFEFTAPAGERPAPICVVAREIRTGEVRQTWFADGGLHAPPFDVGPDSLFVAYYASAELGCCLALCWPLPVRILDLYAEFRCLTSGLTVQCGRGLLGALVHYGLGAITTEEKDSGRALAVRGGPFTAHERLALLSYCQSDVDALVRLLAAMLPSIDLPRALLRGRYMAAAARMEQVGVPIDIRAFDRLRQEWPRIKGRLIALVDAHYGVFVPAGVPRLDPQTPFGAAVIEEAAACNIDPYQLAETVHYLWTEERDSMRESRQARAAARRTTAVCTTDDVLDYSTYPRLDRMARQPAGAHRALGIGRGYAAQGAVEDSNHARGLSDVLRQSDETVRRRHDPGLVREAAELVTSAGPADYRPMTFSAERWEAYLVRKGIPWPRLPSGALALDDDTFRELARAYPADVGPMRELRHLLSHLRLHELAVGADGRNRVLLSAFGTRTGRNAPSNSRFIFGPSTWLRCLIRPSAGRAVAYVDWSQQELAIAAALSGDEKMQHAYRSGDFYLTFAKMAGAAPADATKRTHSAERDQFKTVALGVLYGLSAESLARKLNVPLCKGRELLQMHRDTFRTFWRWSDAVEMQAVLSGWLRTAFGWRVHLGHDVNTRSLRNFPMQAHGAEMLRLACCLATERGIVVCCPVHDALLIEAPLDSIDAVVMQTRGAMREASELVLPGFPLRTDAKIVRYPERYVDERGRQIWDTVQGLLGDVEVGQTPTTDDTLPLPPMIEAPYHR